MAEVQFTGPGNLINNRKRWPGVSSDNPTPTEFFLTTRTIPLEKFLPIIRTPPLTLPSFKLVYSQHKYLSRTFFLSRRNLPISVDEMGLITNI